MYRPEAVEVPPPRIPLDPYHLQHRDRVKPAASISASFTALDRSPAAADAGAPREVASLAQDLLGQRTVNLAQDAFLQVELREYR